MGNHYASRSLRRGDVLSCDIPFLIEGYFYFVGNDFFISGREGIVYEQEESNAEPDSDTSISFD